MPSVCMSLSAGQVIARAVLVRAIVLSKSNNLDLKRIDVLSLQCTKNILLNYIVLGLNTSRRQTGSEGATYPDIFAQPTIGRELNRQLDGYIIDNWTDKSYHKNV